eukprot:CAMPEP_0179105716 /NCGR_PEP_ID=MMETSP0796-20121207/49110_1 /TAXON_ID=73915 /ORGANISM="Pyrodinium bahamense, Strain pbaha01" /LENGTH=45 /DNA_ID= /DNA_START= /DNA_END= /DNA_ORIENTATION=
MTPQASSFFSKSSASRISPLPTRRTVSPSEIFKAPVKIVSFTQRK